MQKLLSLVLLLLLAFSLTAQVKLGGGAKVGGTAKITVTAASGPFVNDTFTETSDTNLESHTGETGATWTLHPSYSGTILVNGSLDRTYLNTAAAAAYTASGVPPSANYCVSADFQRLSMMGINTAIGFGDTSVDTALNLRLNDTGAAQQWEVIDRTTGSSNVLNFDTANVPTVGGAAINAKICRSGTAVTVFFDGVQDTALNSTTTITATGRVWLRFSGQATSTTGIHLDNVSAQ